MKLAETANRNTPEMRYLLGSLSEEDMTRMEEAYFEDDTQFEALQLAEDELIDAYLRDELTYEERRQFSARLQSSPRLMERVKFAISLADKAKSLLSAPVSDSIEQKATTRTADPSPKVPWWKGLFLRQPAWGMAMAACGVLILIGAVVLLSRFRDESARLAAERAEIQRQKDESDRQAREQEARAAQLAAEQRAREEREREQQPLNASHPPDKLKENNPVEPELSSTFATVFVMPGSLRSEGAGPPTLTIKSATRTARLQLALEKNEYPTYAATIKTAEGVEIFRNNRLRAFHTKSGPQLLLSLPARRLQSGDYIVHVDGTPASGPVESVNDYMFLVIKQP